MDVIDELRAGTLVSVLDDSTRVSYDIDARYPSRRFVAMRSRRLIDALAQYPDEMARDVATVTTASV